MVRREGTRFGVNTSQNVRRLPFHYQLIHSQQSVFVETHVAEAHGAVKRQAKSVVKKQLERGAFDTGETSSKHIHYSLNKAKRWEVIENIVEEGENHDNRSIVVEHHMLPRPRCTYSATRSCTGVFDSTNEEGKRLPRKRYAKIHDLRKKEGGEEEVMQEDEDFGKKNRRRSRKGKGVHQHEEEKVREMGGCGPVTTVRYDVTLAAPRHTYQTYCNPVGDSYSGHGKRNRNSKCRTGKTAHSHMQSIFADGLWELETDYLMEEEDFEEHWLEENQDADHFQTCQVSMETLVNNRACSMGAAVYQRDYGTSSGSPQKEKVDTKSKIYPLDEQFVMPYFTRPSDIIHVTKKLEKQRRRRKRKRDKVQEAERIEDPAPAPPPVPEESASEKACVAISITTNDIAVARLEEQFGSGYIEGLCMPRRFAVSITDSIINQLSSLYSNHPVASLLRQSGHQIFTIVDCAPDSWLDMRHDGSLVEEVRVKVCGMKENLEMLDNAMTGLETTDFSQVVNAVTKSVAAMPLESYLTDGSVASFTTKPALNIGTVQSVLGWSYDVTSVNKAAEKTLGSSGTSKDYGTRESVPVGGASNASESCAICFCEFDDMCPGTALISCTHWFCDECWRGHLVARVERGDTDITCPGFGCTSAVDKVTLMSLLPSKLYARHHRNKANVALMLQQDLHWCPRPCCGRLLKLALAGHGQMGSNQNQLKTGKGGVVPVNCECGMFWCSECKQEAHWPATCEQAEAYRKEAKNVIEVKRTETVKVKAKRCPRCSYPIEKTYGCNHMVCKCGYDFCWECGKPFEGDHYYCIDAGKWKFKEYVIKPDLCVDKSAVELAILHHKRRTYAACHNRTRKAQRLAWKMAHPQLPSSSSSSESDSDEASSLGSSTSSISLLGLRGKNPQLERMRNILGDVANFLSEAEFVLEHLEILLSTASPSSQKSILFQHKTRLIFITDQLHKILNEETKLDMGKVKHMLNCGKSCLKLIAVTATQLSNRMTPASTEE